MSDHCIEKVPQINIDTKNTKTFILQNLQFPPFLCPCSFSSTLFVLFSSFIHSFLATPPMGLQLDKDELDSLIVRERDDFYDKYLAARARRQEMYLRFRSFVAHNLGSLRDTTIIHLMLKHNIIFTDHQMMVILKLDPRTPTHRAIFDKLRAVIRHCAIALKSKVPANALIEMPLTDLSRVCYRIAERFESLFCIPVSRVASRQFHWNDRYNGMWPIVCELNKLYQLASVTRDAS